MNDLYQMLMATTEQWAMLEAPALPERFILRNGRCFTGRKLPAGFKKGKIKQCFQNSTLLLDTRAGRRLRYVEGFFMRSDLCFPIMHAWCIDEDDQVVDVTLDRPEECQYVGFVMSRNELWDEITKTECYGVLDTGFGLNHKFMFARDPELEEIVRGVAKNIQFRDVERAMQ